MKKVKSVLMLSVLSGLICGGFAHAGFNIISKPIQEGKSLGVEPFTNGTNNPGVLIIGAPNSPQPVVKGFAKEVSLLTALKQVVPSGWTAKRSGGLDVTKMVSWKGNGQVWTDVLQQMAVSFNFNVQVNYDTKEVTVQPVDSVKLSRAVEPNSKLVEPAKFLGEQVWVLDPKYTLRENIEKWAEAAKWKVSWAAENYEIAERVELKGVFDEEGGPLDQIVAAYATADQPISISLWTNRVVRVENRSKSQLPVKDEPYEHNVLKRN